MGSPFDFYSGPYNKKIYVLSVEYNSGRKEEIQYTSSAAREKARESLDKLSTVKTVITGRPLLPQK